MISDHGKVKHFSIILGFFMSFDFLITVVYLSQEQFETFVQEIKASNLSKTTQWDLIDLLKTARQHTEHARQNGWISENV